MEKINLFGKEFDAKSVELVKVLSVSVCKLIAEKTEFINPADADEFCEAIFDIIDDVNVIYELVKKEEE